jgi:hypothetical protein
MAVLSTEYETQAIEVGGFYFCCLLFVDVSPFLPSTDKLFIFMQIGKAHQTVCVLPCFELGWRRRCKRDRDGEGDGDGDGDGDG